MPDREKVDKGLACCQYSSKSHCYECPYVYDGLCDTNYCTADLASDVLVLLKEQEAVEPTVSGMEEHDGLGSWWYQCGKCKMPIDYGDRFCRHCGKKVKWE